MFVLLPHATKEQAFRVGEEIAAAVSAAVPPPMKLKFEKVRYRGDGYAPRQPRGSTNRVTVAPFFAVEGVPSLFSRDEKAVCGLCLRDTDAGRACL